MRSKSIPIRFGEIAIQEGYVNQQQVHEALKEQSEGLEMRIGEILVDQGVLSTEQRDRTIKIQTVNKTRLENEYFAHVALKKKILSTEKIRKIRRVCARGAAAGQFNTLSKIALEEDFLSEHVIKEIRDLPEYGFFRKLKVENRSLIGKYELIGCIVKTKRATIYKAIQVDLDRLVAVKVLADDCRNETYIKRFFNEARSTARFNHPNLIRVYDIGIEKDCYFYAMELMEGQNLVERFGSDKRLQVGEAMKIIRQTAAALNHMHSDGILHCNINPKNIAMREDGVAKLLDLSGLYSLKSKKPSSGKLKKMPQYTAPEQIKAGSLLDVRTDIYSLGATFYRMLTGSPPISGKDLDEITRNILEREPKPAHEIDFTIPEDLSKIIHRMIRKDPQKRYPEIKNVLFALRKILI